MQWSDIKEWWPVIVSVLAFVWWLLGRQTRAIKLQMRLHMEQMRASLREEIGDIKPAIAAQLNEVRIELQAQGASLKEHAGRQDTQIQLLQLEVTTLKNLANRLTQQLLDLAQRITTVETRCSIEHGDKR